MSDADTILLVEDDLRLGDLLQEYLESQGFVVSRAVDGRAAIEAITREPPTVLILDLMLPVLSGVEVLRRIRPSYAGGVLILTATKTEVDQIIGLELGADDYVTKPIEPRLLLARLRSLLRRVGRQSAPVKSVPDRVSVGALTLDRARREVFFQERRVELTAVEFNLLWSLATRAGDIVTRDELYAEALSARYDGIDRGIDVHVSRVRKKLAEQGYRTSLVLHMDIRPGFTGQLTEKPKLVDEILADKQAK